VRRLVGLLVTAGLLVGGGVLTAAPAQAETAAVPDGSFACAGAAPADPRLSALAVSPDAVLQGQSSVVAVAFSLDAPLTEPPVVALATADGLRSYSEVAVADPLGWRAEIALPEDAPPSELGITLAWADGQATPCGLMARGLPALVALHPVAPAPPGGVVAAAGDGQVVLAWTRGADGAAPITGYRVTTYPGGAVHELAATASRAVLTGLANGTSYTFDVTAVNVAGSSPPASSAPVVPRRRLSLGSLVLPPTKVTYGTVSTVSASVRTATGAAAPGVPVELRARRFGTTTWTTVARATSASNGVVVLRTALKVSSALALVHVPDAAVIPTVLAGGVTVLAKVTAVASDSTAAAGYAQAVTGSVAPAGSTGSAVWLQRYVSGSWRTIATGSLVTSTAYRVRWTPAHAGNYWLRVARPAAGGVATGLSRTLLVAAHDTRVSVAREVLADSGTRLLTYHFSGVVDRATARQNVLDTAAGRAARRSSYGNAPGGTVLLDLRTLRLLRRIGQAASVTIREIAGGSHAPRSLHYQGKALDVWVVNGAKVRPGSGYMVVVRACRAAGASQIYYPAYDPYGGHQGHVHCAFG
jgi:hypothetical protein